MNARKSIAVIVIALLALAPRLGRASERGEEREGANEGATEHDGDRAGVKESAEGVDTQFIFGFTMGADVGEPGEKEIEWETVNRPLKSAGSYAALEASSGPSSRRMSAFASSSVSRSLITKSVGSRASMTVSGAPSTGSISNAVSPVRSCACAVRADFRHPNPIGRA